MTFVLAVAMVSISSGHALSEPSRAQSASPAFSIHKSVEGEPYDEARPRGVKTKALKKALGILADMLRSKKLDRVLAWLQDEAGVAVVRVVRKHARTIADTLDSLAKWDEVTLLIVREQVTGALKSVGVAGPTATKAGFWIEKFISWTLL